MSEKTTSNQPLSAGDMLPPVEPPSAGFILQLFVVPGIIVLIIVMVWLLFNWVARAGNDPDEYVRALRRNNANRWQAAFSLASAINDRDAQGQALRNNSKLAGELAAILNDEIEHGSTTEAGPIKLRVYLCQALGHFEVSDGLPVLLTAAMTGRTDEETEVRTAALQAIALLDENMKGSDAAFHAPETMDKLLTASRDSDPRVRAVGAFALGVIGGSSAHQRLEALLADGNPDVRYNAATWLAADGDARAVPVLAEMLDPDEMDAVNLEKEKELRPNKRMTIVANALRETDRLADKNRDADLKPLETEIEKLIDSSIDPRLKVEARGVLKHLQARGAAGK